MTPIDGAETPTTETQTAETQTTETQTAETQTTETQTAETKTTEEQGLLDDEKKGESRDSEQGLLDDEKKDDEKKDDETPAGAPEAYEAFTFPEGVAPDDTQIESFQTMAKELNLSQESAQKLVDFHYQVVDQITQAAEAQGDQEFSDMTQEWAAEARKDPEFGGSKFDESIAVAKATLNQFGTPGLKEALALSGLTNHPEVIRFAWKLGQAVGEDALVPGSGGSASQPQSAAERMFPSMTGRK